jgi:hypothetical protein
MYGLKPVHFNSMPVGTFDSMPVDTLQLIANYWTLSKSSFSKIWRTNMPLINVVITLMVVGILLWLVNRYIPMQGTIKGILNAVVVIVVVLWVVNAFGLFHYVSQFRVGP